jgi:RimJ/RimL family protein N-acetyltransferase
MAFDFHELTERLERFSSSRLALRPLCLADAWPLYQASRNPLFNENLAWDQPPDIEGVVQRLELICRAARRGELTALAAVVRDTGEWVSLFRFFKPMDNEPGVIEMGIWTHDRFWTGRHSLDLGRLCVDTAFRVSEAERLIGLAAPGNRGSRHLMVMCGMTERRQSFKFHETGRKLPTVQYEITRAEWQASCAEKSPFYEFDRPARPLGVLDRGDTISVKERQESMVPQVVRDPVAKEDSLAELLMKRWSEQASSGVPATRQLSD